MLVVNHHDMGDKVQSPANALCAVLFVLVCNSLWYVNTGKNTRMGIVLGGGNRRVWRPSAAFISWYGRTRVSYLVNVDLETMELRPMDPYPSALFLGPSVARLDDCEVE